VANVSAITTVAATLLGFLPATAGHSKPVVVQPTTYRSGDGHYELFVEPEPTLRRRRR
jgi:hypothetical protein